MRTGKEIHITHAHTHTHTHGREMICVLLKYIPSIYRYDVVRITFNCQLTIVT